jgi:L-rhamnose isomerase
MTQEIIEMAKQAGFPFNKYDLLQGDDEGEIDAHEMFEAFAKLVAAKEREACAKVADLVAKEVDDTNGVATYIGKAIRARGEK